MPPDDLVVNHEASSRQVYLLPAGRELDWDRESYT